MSPSTLLLLKLLLAPGLVGTASLLMPRLGPQLAGAITALPVVTGPVFLLFALEQGHAFTAAAAEKTLIGTVALLSYTSAYALLARLSSARLWAWICLLLGWGAFLLMAVAVKSVAWPMGVGIPIALGSIVGGLRLLPSVVAPTSKASASRTTCVLQLLLRMTAAALLVWSLTATAARLGPTWSGLLTAFPVASTVMLVATHLEYGLAMALGWLRGFLLGLFGYVVFVGCVAHLIVPFGLARSFAAGLVGAILVQVLVTRWSRRK